MINGAAVGRRLVSTSHDRGEPHCPRDRRHEIFDGPGAATFVGRWNSPGRRIIYAAETYAGAMLEALVNSNIGRIPKQHAWIETLIPEGVGGGARSATWSSTRIIPGFEKCGQPSRSR
jgi:hypothetical protein